jgi:hypothetical protein
MNLPAAPIAEEGFYVTHFLTVADQERSARFYVDVLGGKVVKAKNPCYIKLSNAWIILTPAEAPRPTSLRSSSAAAGPKHVQQLSQPARRRHRKVLSRVEGHARSSWPSPGTSTAGRCAATCAIPTATSSRWVSTARHRSSGFTNSIADWAVISTGTASNFLLSRPAGIPYIPSTSN